MESNKKYSWKDFQDNKKGLIEQMKDTSVSYIFIAFMVLITLVTVRSIGANSPPLTTLLVILGINLFIFIVWAVFVKLGKATFHPFTLGHQFKTLYKNYLDRGHDVVGLNIVSDNAWWGPFTDPSDGESTSFYLRIVCREEDVSANQSRLMEYLETNFSDAIAFESIYLEALQTSDEVSSLPGYGDSVKSALSKPMIWSFSCHHIGVETPKYNQYDYGILVDSFEYSLPIFPTRAGGDL